MIEDPTGWDARVIVGNDGLSAYSGTYEILDGISGEILYSGEFESKANENTPIIDIPLSKNITQYFILILKADGKTYVNHYINYGGALDKKQYLAFMENYSRYTEIKKF